ncbi:MAG TPA: EAL domain-containing protein [Azospirillaceae bacterium]|nr:EAL domain-containing protein [Azospirillaceae bacterium]
MSIILKPPAPDPMAEGASDSAPRDRLLDPVALRRAIDAGRVEVLYQPIVTVATREVAGFEALARLRGEDGGLIPPDRFIPLAEETGLIVPLGEAVLRVACAQAAAWAKARLPVQTVSVNLSAKQADDPALRRRVHAALKDAGLPAHRLVLELTETTLFGGPHDATRTVTTLAGDGVRIVLDDFGTGWSSLAYLARFPISALKIDRSFVQRMVEDPRRCGAIVQAIVGLAHTLGLESVAEGVETEAQRLFLQAYRCDRMQGYLIARPLRAADATRMLENAASG